MVTLCQSLVPCLVLLALYIATLGAYGIDPVLWSCPVPYRLSLLGLWLADAYSKELAMPECSLGMQLVREESLWWAGDFQMMSLYFCVCL